MAEMAEIMDLARGYAADRTGVEALVAEIKELQRQVVAERMPELRRLAAQMGVTKDQLVDAIEHHPELFAGGKETPRTRAVDGVKFGLRKMPGKLVWPKGADAAVVKKIRQHLPEDVDRLIRVTEKPVSEALRHLPTRELARLGVSLEADRDQVVVSGEKGDVDQVVRMLMDDVEAA